MFEGRFCALLVLAGLLAMGAVGAAAQTTLAPLNMVPSAPDVLGRVPNHLVWLKRGLQAVQDPVDGQLVFLADEGHVIGRVTLPPKFRIGTIVPGAEHVRLVDATGQQQVIVERSIDPRAVTSLAASAVRAGGSKRQSRVVRKSAQQLLYADGPPGRRPLDVRTVTAGTLAQVYEIGLPTGGDRYLVSEEIVSAAPGLQVRVFVQRFDRVGKVTGIAFLSLDEMDVVPRDFVTVTDEGELRVLVPTATGVRIRAIQFSKPARSALDAKSSEEDLANLGVVVRETTVDSNVAPVDGVGGPSPEAKRFKLRAPTPAISRDRVLMNARAYLAVNWVMSAANYSSPAIENRCQPEASKFWLRPARFTEATIGTTIGPMPYRWGGDDTPETFKLRTELGALAGDICTCRDPDLDYCLVPESAGVDCSGFVSRAWGIEKLGTSGLMDVGSELKSLAELRPGDAFVWPGRHTRLFVAVTPGAASAFSVLESSTRQDCEGVCQRTYRPSELNGYRMVRYSGITN